MAPIEHYRNLKERKAALLVESDLNRLVLRLEMENLRLSTSRIDTTLTTARRFGPWLLPLVSALGIFTGRKARKESGGASWLKLLVRLAPALLQLRKTKSPAE